MKTYKQFKEQLVVPRGLKYPGMSAKSEMEVLKRLSNRKTVFDKAVTGRRIAGVSEENKHRDAKVNYQYKILQNPKDPREDMIKDGVKVRVKKA